MPIGNSNYEILDDDRLLGESVFYRDNQLVTGSGSPVSGGVSSLVSTSRAALAADSGATLELASGVTYTISASVPLPGGVTLIGPASGTATLACTGGATLNGATTSVTIPTGKLASALQRASSASAYLVAVQA